MSTTDRSAIAATKCHNRIAALMIHATRYSFRGTSRLAMDAGVAKSTISLLARGLTTPLYSTLRAVIQCLEFHLGCPLDPKEVISEDGTYPTEHVCKLVGCSRCLPDSAYHRDGTCKEEYKHILPGHWTGDVNEFKAKED